MAIFSYYEATISCLVYVRSSVKYINISNNNNINISNNTIKINNNISNSWRCYLLIRWPGLVMYMPPKVAWVTIISLIKGRSGSIKAAGHFINKAGHHHFIKGPNK